MSVYIDRKFLLMVSSRLERFSQKNKDLFNFRCPICGDSRKNKLKARGYIYRKDNDYFYTCHNCHASTTFSKFLKHIDGEVYREYALERYTNGENGHSNYEKPVFQLSGPKPSERLKKNSLKELQTDGNFVLVSINNLEDSHPVRKYISSRKIPKQYWNEVYYTDKFKDFLDLNFKEHGKEKVPNDERVLLFYTNKEGNITNVAGRAVSENAIRYITVKVTDEKKVFGMHRVDVNKKVYVTEGQFDSLFVENAIATGDSNLVGAARDLALNDYVLVFDNEPRNKEIVKQINKAIENNMTVCLFPETIVGKDVNEMIQNGLNINEIKSVIDANTFSGLEAKLRFVTWKKV